MSVNDVTILGCRGSRTSKIKVLPEMCIRDRNPFSAEYDKLGYGRIEIFTKPGTDKFHGQLLIDGNDSSFNSRNPFSPAEPAYYTTFFSGNLSGPINKKASFFLDVERRNINNVCLLYTSRCV